MSSLVLIIPAAAVVMRIVFPESPHQASILPHLDLARLKIERASRMERPKNVRISVEVVGLDPVTRTISPAALVPTMDFNLEVVPHKNITIIWMPELAETILFNRLNDVSRMEDEAQRYNFPGARSSQQPWGVVGVQADVVVVIGISVI
jgi:hypothetical protein